MTLMINTLLAQADSEGNTVIERVLYVDRQQDVAQTIRVDRHDGLNRQRSVQELDAALLSGQVRILENDPYAHLQHGAQRITERSRRRLDRAMEIIQPIIMAPNGGVFLSEVRGPLVYAASRKHGVTKKRIYQHLRRWMQGGMTEFCFQPRYFECGGPGKERAAGSMKRGRPRMIGTSPGASAGINVGADERNKLQRGYRLFVLKERGKGGYPIKKAYEMTLTKFFATSAALRNGVVTPILPSADNLPTLKQFKYWGPKGVDFQEYVIRRHGQRRFDLKHRPILGDSTSLAMGPGSVYQIDSTIADAWIVSALVRSRRLGRPVLYLVIDVFTRLIVGFHLGLEHASFLAAGIALENAFADKVKFCASLGVELVPAEWPSYGLSESIFADRGELEGPAADMESSTAVVSRSSSKTPTQRKCAPMETTGMDISFSPALERKSRFNR